MTIRSEALTALPLVFFFVFSSFIMSLTLLAVDSYLKNELLFLGSSLFVGGLVMTLCWVYYWKAYGRLRGGRSGSKPNVSSLPSMAGLLLTFFGSFALCWIVQIAWYDMIFWGKDIGSIFFGSRASESIGLGIGMKAIHYLLIGLALFFSGIVVLIRGMRRKSPECPHHLGYLRSLSNAGIIPQECMTCAELWECKSLSQT